MAGWQTAWRRGAATVVRHRAVLEPLLAVTALYWLQFLATRLSVKTVPTLVAAQPVRGFPAILFTGWDAVHYFRLARQFDSYAWPPLYPLMLRAVGGAAGSLEAAAVWVNLAAHVAIVFLAYAFVEGEERFREVPGWLFAGLLLFFPGNNVFFAAYSESLFVALAMAACLAWRRERLLWAGLLCGAAVLTRNMGVFLGLGLTLVELSRAFRERQLNLRRLSAVCVWLVPFVAWNLWLQLVAHTSPIEATQGWQQELLEHHVPTGENARLWVLGYLMLPGHKELVFFWAAVGATIFCFRQQLKVEGVFMAAFLLSLVLYLYRPFPFSRYVSALFPLPLAIAWSVRRWPALQALALATALVVSQTYEVLLFSDRMGEP